MGTFGREYFETLHLPGDAALHLSPASWQIVPDDANLSFLGQPGRSVYICPQDEQEDILFLGIAADEIPAGVFEKDTLSLSLTKVEGPGAVSLYSSDAFGNPTLFFDSSDGLGEDDLFSNVRWRSCASELGLYGARILSNQPPSIGNPC